MLGIPRRTIHLYPGELKDLWVAANETAGQQRALVAGFEDHFARRFGVRWAIPTGSGRLGMRLLLESRGIGPGDEVILPAFTDESVPEAVQRAGATPVFVDVDRRTFNLDIDQLRAIESPRVKAVVALHIFGAPCDMDAVLSIAEERGWFVLEDCAHAIDSRTSGALCGSLGDGAIFSFVVTKAINTFGGGMVTCRRDETARFVRDALADLPQPDPKGLARRIAAGYALNAATRPEVFGVAGMPLLKAMARGQGDIIGLYNKLVRPSTVNAHVDNAFSPIQAAVGLRQLRALDETQAARRSAAEAIMEALPSWVSPQRLHKPDDQHSYYFLVAHTPEPDRLTRELLRRGVDIGRNPMRNVAALAEPAQASRFPNAQYLYENGVQLPIHPSLGEAAVARVVDAVKRLPR